MSVNEQIAETLSKSVITIFKKRKVYAKFKHNIWAASLAEMISFSSKKKNVKYLLSVIDVFTRLTWFKHLKYKKGETVLNTFTKIVN